MNIEMTVTAMQYWLQNASPGDTLTYHIGNLAEERERIVEGKSYKLQPFDNIGNVAYEAYERGEVYLVQKRLHAHRFAYIMIKALKEAPSADEPVAG